MDNLKRKDGFTLIELLAVIVILAIVALIAVPVVMNIIDKAQKSAFKDSAYGIIKAGELYYSEQQMGLNGMEEDKLFIFPNNIEGLEINGSKPISGAMLVNKKGQIILAIANGKYCITKGYNDSDIVLTNDVFNCELPPRPLSELATIGKVISVDGKTTTEINKIDACVNNKTKDACETGTPFLIKVNDKEKYKFYVIRDDGDKVTLIMDRNLYNQEDLDSNTYYVPWISLEDYKIAMNDNTITSQAAKKGPITALKILKDRTKKWTNIPVYTYTLKNDKDGLNGIFTYSDIIGEVVTDVTTRLPNYTELNDLITKNENVIPDYLYDNLYKTGDDNSHHYWTSTENSSNPNYALSLQNDWNGPIIRINNYVATMISGLRPVITLSK